MKKSNLNMSQYSLLTIGLMWVLPFLYYYHCYPITTFYQEWFGVFLSLIASAFLFYKSKSVEIPHIVLLPIAMIGVVLIQFIGGKIGIFGQAELYIVYFVWIALLITIGRKLRNDLGLPTIAITLASFLAIGAELNALIGLAQHYHWHTFLDSLIAPKVSPAVYGNIAQPNHYADYMALGLVSVGLLHVHFSFRWWKTLLLAAPLLFVMVLSGSRSGWLYLFLMAGAGAYYLWKRKESSYWTLFKYSALVLAGFVLAHIAVQMPWLSGDTQITTVQRLMGGADYLHIRFYLWNEAMSIFTQFPILGAGFGQFAWQHFLLGAEYQDIRINGLYNNAHNIVFQLAAETGIAGLSILILTLSLWSKHIYQEKHTIFHWWGLICLAILGIHSLLEYPLWYGYFIGIAAILLGIFDTKIYVINHKYLKKILLGTMFIASFMAISVFIGYQSLESIFFVKPLSQTDNTYMPRIQAKLDDAKVSTLLYPYIKIYEASATETSPYPLDEKLAKNELAMHFIPNNALTYREIWILALSGRMEDAKMQIERCLWAYPSEFPYAIQYLRQMASKDFKMAELWEFAVQEQEKRNQKVLEAK